MNLKQGDILVNNDGDKRKVLGVCGEVYAISVNELFEEMSYWFTKKDIEENGWTLEEKPWEPKYKERYWFIDSYGEVQCLNFIADEVDLFRKSFGNVHRTLFDVQAFKQRLIEWGGKKV